MVCKALYDQAPKIPLISSPTVLLLTHSSHSAPFVVLQTHSHIPTSGPLHWLFISAWQSLPRFQLGSLFHLFYVFMQSFCLSETLPTGWGQTPITLATLSMPFLCFIFLHSISAHLAYIFYLLFLSPKRTLISTKARVLFVLFDSAPSIPRTHDTGEAFNNRLLNKWIHWGLTGIMYVVYMAMVDVQFLSSSPLILIIIQCLP